MLYINYITLCIFDINIMGLNLRSLKKITRFLKTRSSLNKTRLVKETESGSYIDINGNIVLYTFEIRTKVGKWRLRFNEVTW